MAFDQILKIKREIFPVEVKHIQKNTLLFNQAFKIIRAEKINFHFKTKREVGWLGVKFIYFLKKNILESIFKNKNLKKILNGNILKVN